MWNEMKSINRTLTEEFKAKEIQSLFFKTEYTHAFSRPYIERRSLEQT